MKFNFIVAKSSIAINMIRNDLLNKDFASQLFEKYNEDFLKVQKGKVWYFHDVSDMPLIQEIYATEEFEKTYQQCEQNSLRIQANLAEHKDEIEEFLNGLCKMDLPDLSLDVHIVPQGGLNVFGKNLIVWGHEKGYVDKFYDLVYLYHEALHSVFDRTDVSHCIIQMLTDHKLANHFHPELKNGYDGHKSLMALEEQLKPFFDLYFRVNKNDVVKHLKEDGRLELAQRVFEISKKLSKLNIKQFETYINKKEDFLKDLAEKSSVTVNE